MVVPEGREEMGVVKGGKEACREERVVRESNREGEDGGGGKGEREWIY